jgi:hypothetical protein
MGVGTCRCAQGGDIQTWAAASGPAAGDEVKISVDPNVIYEKNKLFCGVVETWLTHGNGSSGRNTIN